jgi:diguanylate cyclase (GGDEF)-like protein
LTACLNRRGLIYEIEKELAKAKRYKSEFCIFIFDLDHFKSINDRYGHNGGDAVLRSVSLTLRQQLRGTDSVGRWGGEEFVGLLVNIGLQQGIQKADEIRERISEAAIEIGGDILRVTTSVGVACFTGAETLDQLVDIADRKLYEAKQSGRNKVCG